MSRIREQFSTTALILSIIAVVMAAGGAAYAAKQAGLNSKQKKEVTKIAKGFQGSGPKGDTGAPGSAGATGPAGKNGDKGEPGASAIAEDIDLGDLSACGGRGGAMVGVKPVANIEICNGEKGAEGSPWTDVGTLPPGATETGTWAFTATNATEEVRVPISFPIPYPLEPEKFLGPTHVHFGTGSSAPCTGTADEPTAPSGELCIYRAGAPFGLEGATLSATVAPSGNEEGAGKSGTMLHFIITEATARGQGSWAITGPPAAP
jgi:hypothetical protein